MEIDRCIDRQIDRKRENKRRTYTKYMSVTKVSVGLDYILLQVNYVQENRINQNKTLSPSTSPSNNVPAENSQKGTLQKTRTWKLYKHEVRGRCYSTLLLRLVHPTCYIVILLGREHPYTFLPKLSCREPGQNMQPLGHEPSTVPQSHPAYIRKP